MWHGSPPRRNLLPFSKPGYYQAKRTNKSQPKAQECFSLGPGRKHPRDSARELTENNSVITIRNVTWQHTPLGSHANLPKEAECRFSVGEIKDCAKSAQGRGGGDNEKDEGDESELIEATRVAETITPECTSDCGREYCSNGSTARDRNSVFSSNHSGESRGHTPAGAESVPTHSGAEESSSSSSTAESVISAPEADPSGRAAHELRDFLPGQESCPLREGRTRGETRRLQEMAMKAIDEAVCAHCGQARDVQEDAWALIAEAPQDSGKCGVSVPLGTLMRGVEKAAESNAAVEKSECRELWLGSDRKELHKLWDAGKNYTC